ISPVSPLSPCFVAMLMFRPTVVSWKGHSGRGKRIHPDCRPRVVAAHRRNSQRTQMSFRHLRTSSRKSAIQSDSRRRECEGACALNFPQRACLTSKQKTSGCPSLHHPSPLLHSTGGRCSARKDAPGDATRRRPQILHEPVAVLCLHAPTSEAQLSC